VQQELVGADEDVYNKIVDALKQRIFYDQAQETQRKLDLIADLLPAEISDLVTTKEDE